MNKLISPSKSKIWLIALAFIAFISLGLPDGLLGVAFPSIRSDFQLRLDSLGLLLIAVTAGYITSSFTSGRAIARLGGVGGVLAVSCFLTASGLLGYTFAPNYASMIFLGLLLGLGAGAIDAGINTYVATHFSESMMQWLHASFGVGVTLGPIIMTAGLSNFDSWRWGYRLVGLAQLALSLTFFATSTLWRDPPQTEHAQERKPHLMEYKTSMRETLRQPMVWLSALMFVIYAGVEVSFGNWTYSLLTLSRGVAPTIAGIWSSSYWATFTLGRICAGIFARKVPVPTLLLGGLLAALAGALLVWWNPFPLASVLGVSVIGFAIAPIFPGLVSATSARVGEKYAANTIGIQISGAGLGGALISGFAGVLAQQIGLEAIPVYLTILFAILLSLYLISKRRQ